MSKKTFEFRKVKDKGDKFATKKDIIFNIPFRLCIVGRTGSGKTSGLISLLLDENFYKKDFEGKNIYLFSPMINDFKMELLVEKKGIPDLNIFQEMDDNLLNELYDTLTEQFAEEMINFNSVSNKLIILDDLSFDGSLRKGLFNAVNRVFCNGRKNAISICITSQFYTHISPVCRSNASGLILYNMSDRQLDNVSDENNYLKNKRQFKKLFRDNVKEQHDKFIINYSNNREEGLYQDNNFKKIG